MKEKPYLPDMKRALSKSYKQVFRDLYESVNGLYAYTFYSRYKMPPNIVFQFIEKYGMEDVLIYKEGKISLTEKGRNVALSYIKKIKSNTGDRFSNIPNEFIDTKLEINSLYLPDVKDFVKI